MTLVERACSARHGLVGPPMVIPATAADPPGVVHASVPMDDEPSRSAGGGAARSLEAATTAAVGEAIERYVAVHATVPVRRVGQVPAAGRVLLPECTLHSKTQRDHPEFPHRSSYPTDEWLGEMFDLATNEACWAPAALISLVDDYGPLATSSGLAAAPTATRALLRALQELVERDAYVTTWLHQLGGREVDEPAVSDELAALGGGARVFDLTPRFSPHPVAIVAGEVALAGRRRPSIGIACRATWADAVEKAFVECCQGIVFVGHRLTARPELFGLDAGRVTGFDEHAIYYAANPQRWAEVPLLRHAVPAPRPGDAPSAGAGDVTELEELVMTLAGAGVRSLYRDLTTADANQAGVRVVRVVTPALTPLHHDHRWPYLGGRTVDIGWRYPDAARRGGDRPFPSPFPHALG